MLTNPGKRKRARKACISCHQRKRKCDSKYPCGMCTTYEYTCSYADNDSGSNSVVTLATPQFPAPAKRVRGRLQSGAASNPGIDEHRVRYAGSSAAMAFPHILSMALGSDTSSNHASKMQSLGYNFGIRPDEISSTHGSLSALITEEELTFYSGVFFSAMGSVFDVVDPRIYAQRCYEYYHVSGGTGTTALAFSALAAGIAALGSFLSLKRHSREADLVQHAKAILDDPGSMHMVEVDHVLAWTMRTLYLRATTRPDIAWIASCTCMHLCEAIGLHKEENIKVMSSIAGVAALGHDADRLRRIFWISWAGHTMLSYEYDRSSVQFRAVTTQATMPISDSAAHQFVQIVQIIPSPNSPFELVVEPRTRIEELHERLKALHELQCTNPFLIITKADIAFCLFRRAYQLNMGLSDEFLQLVVTTGNAAVREAEQLARQGRFFWNVIGSVFHYACVLLAAESPITAMHIPSAFKGLESLVAAANTGHTREALKMAQCLLSLYLERKREEIARLETVQGNCPPVQVQLESEATADIPENDYGLDWDQFLFEPYISTLSGDVQI